MSEKVPPAHPVANSASKVSKIHGFSPAEQQRLEQMLRAVAKEIAPTPIGPSRNALYKTHRERVLDSFEWDFTKATMKWTSSSIRKILANYLFDFNKKAGSSSKSSKPVKPSKSTTSSMPSKTPETVHLKKKNMAKRTRVLKPNLAQGPPIEPQIKAEDADMASPEAPAITSVSPGVSTDAELIPSYQSPVNFITSSVEHNTTTATPRADSVMSNTFAYGQQLTHVILVVRPSETDPWGRKIFSIPLWRCQCAENGSRDASPESLRDWRDVSFQDFVRQLKTEEILSAGQVIIWGEYKQIVTSDVTFAGAIQEQLIEAAGKGLEFNEATFMVANSVTGRDYGA